MHFNELFGFLDNLFYNDNSDDVISYKEQVMTIEEFNAIVDENIISGNLQADPLFVDILNSYFNLQEASPAIDAGLDVGLFQDYDGNSVPKELGVDIGA